MKRILLFLIAIGVVAPSRASELLGPLRIQDMSPVALARLDMLAPPAATDAKWRVELTTSQANVYTMDENARAYLASRGVTREFTQADAQAMLSQGKNMFLFDGEMAVTNLIVSRKMSRRTELEVVVPYHAFGGGNLDSLIEGFHRGVGLNDAGRDLVPRNQVAFIQKIDDNELALVDNDGDAGIGDATITLRYRDQLSGPWSYVVETAVRVPTGKGELYFSSENPNYGVQGSIQRQGIRNGLYFSASYVRPGKTRVINEELNSVPTLIGAYERSLTGRTSAILQTSWSQSSLQGTNIPELTQARTQVSLGLRQRHGNTHVWIALTENVINYKNTPDIGVHLGIARVVGR